MTEWRRGWRIILGAALAAGTGINLLYTVSSIFLPQLQRETGWTLGQFSQVSALVGLGSLAAPAAGWAMDRFGFRRVYALGMILIAMLYVGIATLPLVPILYASAVFIAGLVGLMTSSIAYTRAVNGWFTANRGFALSLAATGLSLSAVIAPPLFERLVSAEGWRAGYLALAALAALVGLPAVLVFLRDGPAAVPWKVARERPVERSHLRTSVFWLLALMIFCLNFPGAGMLSQMVPMLLEEGLTSTNAALGISAFAAGQVVGRLACGGSIPCRSDSDSRWCLRLAASCSGGSKAAPFFRLRRLRRSVSSRGPRSTCSAFSSRAGSGSLAMARSMAGSKASVGRA